MDFLKTPSWIYNLSDRNKRIGAGISSVLAGAAILAAYFQSAPTPIKYAEAEIAVSQWEASPLDETLYQNMKGALRSLPDLQKKYEASIAQKLLDVDRIGEALSVATPFLERMRGEVPFHAAYGKTSLLIEQGAFQEALEQAVALKEQMGDSFLTESKGGSLLYIYNLLRIACLQQELKNRAGEKAAWEDLEQVLEKKSPVAETLLSVFSNREIDLTHYIAERKRGL